MTSSMTSPMTSPEGSAHDRAEAFLRAIVRGEHTTIWELLSDDGRRAALSVAMENGMDRAVAGRIHDGLADPIERQEFLRQLVHGLRRDLRSVDLPNLSVDADSLRETPSTASIAITSPSLIPGTDGWAAGQLVLSRDEDRGWCIDRMEPRLAGP